VDADAQDEGEVIVSGFKRPGMSLTALCEYVVEELALQLRGSGVLPEYYDADVRNDSGHDAQSEAGDAVAAEVRMI